ILAWRGTPQGFGAATSFGFSSTFPPRGSSLQEIEELLAVPGVTPELFHGSFVNDAEGRLYPHEGLKDCFSVWGSMGPFDANTASPSMLEAYGMPPPAIQAFLERRKLAPITPADLGTFGVPGRFR